MRNNNDAVIRRLISRSLKFNKKRNFFIITAIALTTFLIASVFSLGMSLMESMKLQQTRIVGTAAHATITRPTSSQIEKLKQLNYVRSVGTSNSVAVVKNTPQMGDMKLSLYYFDKTEWEKLRSPACTNIVGYYPQKANEMMAPLWVLERMGINKPVVGMKIPLSYYVKSGNDRTIMNGDFILSGWFTNYTNIQSGNSDSILVSKELSLKHGQTVGSDGATSITFDDSSRVLEYCKQLNSDLELSENQQVSPVSLYDTDRGSTRSTLIALSIVIAFFVFTGYLLIYNVLYISVSRDVRFYGLLKTLGTTPKQIRRIVIGQILRLCVLGIPIGAVCALLFSLVVVPAVLSMLGSVTTGTVVSFSPLIYLGAVFFALLTALLGAFKPAKKAAGISPIEAQKFSGLKYNKSHITAPAHGKPYKMALRNIFRDKKRAVVVFLSLFLGITTFITVTTVVASMGIDNYIASYFESDFVLQNNTVNNAGSQKQKFDQTFMDKMKALPGLEGLHTTTQRWMRLGYSQDAFGKYVDTYRKKNDIPNLTDQQIQKSFTGFIADADRTALEKVNQTINKPIDIDAFERGDFALISTDDPSLFSSIHELTVFPIQNSSSSVKANTGSTNLKLPLGGFVPLGFKNIGSSFAPTVFVSSSLMNKLYDEPIIATVNIDVAKGREQQTLDTLKQIVGQDHEISRTSRLEAQRDLTNAKVMLYILGGGIALILALIGILNFVNVMSVGILVRKQELAIFESIGMSPKQIKKMLVDEGLGYAAFTLFFVLTAGNAIVFGIFNLFRRQATYAVLTYPLVPVIIACLAVIAICVITPHVAYHSMSKASIVERLREGE